MNGNTHTVTGLACGLTVAALGMSDPLTLQGAVLGSGAALIASTLPDCDQYRIHVKEGFECIAKLVLFCFLFQWLNAGAVNWQYAFFLILAILAGAMTDHRSATHSVMAAVVFTWIFWNVAGKNQGITIWFAAAYLSHLVLDILNKRGEMLFWPFSRKRFCLRLFRSEGMVGKIIFRIAGVWYLMLLGWALLSQWLV